MFDTYLARGLKAGLVAGLAFGLFVAFVGNPFVSHAEALARGGHAHGAGGAHASSVTALASVGGGVLWGLLAGAVFGVAFFVFEPAIPGPRGARGYLLAAAGFVTVSGAPWLVLPPSVPGTAETLPTRTRLALYAAMMLAGLVACLLAGVAYREASDRYDRRVGALAAAMPLAALPLVAAFAPANATTSAVSPALVAAYRGVVALGQVTLWAVLAGTHAWLHRRSPSEVGRRRRTPVTAD
ncbi:MAG: CbtA family protein [Haloplanus sp.]